MSLKKNVIANFIGQGWSALMGLAFVPLYIQYLGIEAYGLIGFYALMQAWLTLLDMGITQTLNREMARYAAGGHTSKSILDLLRSLEIISIVIAFFISLVVWQSSNLIAQHWLNANSLENVTVANAITLMGFVIAIRFIEGIYKGALLGLQKQVNVNLINIVFSTLRFGCVIGVLHFFKATIEIFFIWQAICSMFSLLIFAIFVYKEIPTPFIQPKFSTHSINEVKSFAKGMVGIFFLALLLTQVDKLLLSKLIPLKDYGIYTLASTIASGLILIVAPTTQAIYPKLVEYITRKKNQELMFLYHQGTQLISVLVIPITMMLMFFPEQVVFSWSGNSYLASITSPVLLPLALGFGLNALMWMPYQLQLSFGETKTIFNINLIAVIFIVPALLIVTPRYGAIGAAWIWASLNIGYFMLGSFFMHKNIIVVKKFKWYWNDILLPAIASLVVMSVGKYFFMLISESRIHGVVFLTLILITSQVFTLAFAKEIRCTLINYLHISKIKSRSL